MSEEDMEPIPCGAPAADGVSDGMTNGIDISLQPPTDRMQEYQQPEQRHEQQQQQQHDFDQEEGHFPMHVHEQQQEWQLPPTHDSISKVHHQHAEMAEQHGPQHQELHQHQQALHHQQPDSEQKSPLETRPIVCTENYQHEHEQHHPQQHEQEQHFYNDDAMNMDNQLPYATQNYPIPFPTNTPQQMNPQMMPQMDQGNRSRMPYSMMMVDFNQMAARVSNTMPAHHHQQHNEGTNLAYAGQSPTPNAINPPVQSPPATRRNGNHGSDVTYVLRIHDMLESTEREGCSHIVSWLGHGRAFKVHNEKDFIAVILPRYFKAKMASFTRWLRAWGFSRMTEGPDRGAWFHRYFVRGVTDLCHHKSRTEMLTAMQNWLEPGRVPNFYTCGFGDEHSSHRQPAPDTLQDVNDHGNAHEGSMFAKNPKALRGTVLEDIRQLLFDAQQEGNTGVVSWLRHGRAFKIHDKERFTHTIMPRYFKTCKPAHLVDTLRLWGFKTTKSGEDKGALFHINFVRGEPALSRHKSRQQMKDAMKDWPTDGGIPDFYNIMPKPIDVFDVQPELINTAALLRETQVSPTMNHEEAAAELQREMATLDHPNVNGNMNDPMNPAMGDPHHCNDLPTLDGQHASTIDGSHFLDTTRPHDALLEFTDAQQTLQMPVLEDTQNKIDGERTYVLRVHDMLEEAEKGGFRHIVSWCIHGRAFKIHREKDFVDQIMPRFFRAKMVSFTRWLRAWGFIRMTEGRDRGAWYHRYFVRGVTHLCSNMSRVEMLAAMKDWLPVGTVPDFYRRGGADVGQPSLAADFQGANNIIQDNNPKMLRGTIPESIRAMLTDAEEEDNSSIISWCPHGRAFKISDKRSFTSAILPRYLKAAKFSYFSDTIRVWGWVRIKRGIDKGAYFHRLFMRGRPGLTRHMTRKQMKVSMEDFTSLDGPFPNLYAPDADAQIARCVSNVTENQAQQPAATNLVTPTRTTFHQKSSPDQVADDQIPIELHATDTA